MGASVQWRKPSSPSAELFNGQGGDAPEHISAEAVCSN